MTARKAKTAAAEKPAPAAPAAVDNKKLNRAMRRATALANDGATPAKTYNYPIQPPTLFPGIAPKGTDAPVLAMDLNPYSFAQQFGLGGGFPGFQYLSQLATRAEYREMAAAMATEITREWIDFTSSENDDDASKEKIKKIEAAFKKLGVRDTIGEAVGQDCFFGRAQIFIKIKGADNTLPLILAKETVPPRSLDGITTVEAVWTTPATYNALDPTMPDFYRPPSWFMLGKQVHASRLMTIITRPLPDILKPAFNFAGISLSQLAEPYVDNWLRTRQSVADLVNNFSITVLATSMGQTLQSDDTATDLMTRASFFTAMRSNKGLMVIDKESEELGQTNTPLSGLAELQVQSQEQMCSVSRIPSIILTGISPGGLNASSDSEIRVFYDWIAAQQEAYWRTPIETILKCVQLSEFGEIDPSIGFVFRPLYQMTPKELAEIRKSDADADAVYLDRQVLAAEEVRERLAKDELSGYNGLDIGDLPEPPAEPKGETDPAKAKPAQDAGFSESDHPRDADGKFASGGGGFAGLPDSVKTDIATAIFTRDAYAKNAPYMEAWQKAGRNLDDFEEPGIAEVLEKNSGDLKVKSINPADIDNAGRAVSPQFVQRYIKMLGQSDAPPIVIAQGENGKMKIIEGGHRLAAAKAAGKTDIAAVDITEILNADPAHLFRNEA